MLLLYLRKPDRVASPATGLLIKCRSWILMVSKQPTRFIPNWNCTSVKQIHTIPYPGQPLGCIPICMVHIIVILHIGVRMCMISQLCWLNLALFPGLLHFYLPFALTIIHERKELRKTGKGVVSFIMWVDTRWMWGGRSLTSTSGIIHVIKETRPFLFFATLSLPCNMVNVNGR